MKNFSFEILKKSNETKLARVGIIHTPHGDIETPAFIPVATKATIKSILIEDFDKYINSEAILANTYHLYLQPGNEIVKKHGGFAKMMNYYKNNNEVKNIGPTFTDSGGFQVFSLGNAMGVGVSKIATREDITNDNLEKLKEKQENFFEKLKKFFFIPTEIKNKLENKKSFVKINENGVEFRSIIDGSKHFFTPEKSIDIQHDLGADIIFVFDECTSPLANYEYQKEAMKRTHRWAERCLIHHKKLGVSSATNNMQALFAIIQGGIYKDLRKESAKVLSEMDFDGFGIGGSFTKEDMKEILEITNNALPENKPRHFLGIGEIEDLFFGIENGIDTFDCVSPTRIARNGVIYSYDAGPHKKFRINILNNKYKNDFSPISSDKNSYSHKYTKAYLHHLFKSNEMIAASIASIHNLYFIVNLVKRIRQSILEDRFYEFRKEILGK